MLVGLSGVALASFVSGASCVTVCVCAVCFKSIGVL